MIPHFLKTYFYLSTEDCSAGSDEEDRENSDKKWEDGREEEAPPLPAG